MANQFTGQFPDPEPGDRFGRFTVIETLHEAKGERRVQCRCDCGVERVVRFASLRRGLSKSCGCLHSESTTARNVKRRQQVRSLQHALDTHALAWAAGFFDGEGTTTAYDSAGRSKSRVLVQISQSGSPELLHRFRDAVGGLGTITGPYKYQPRSQDIYRYCAYGFELSQTVVAMLWKWLGSAKREQAEEALLYLR